jgi:hypothetical protein
MVTLASGDRPSEHEDDMEPTTPSESVTDPPRAPVTPPVSGAAHREDAEQRRQLAERPVPFPPRPNQTRVPYGAAMAEVFTRYPAERFERGDVLIENTFMQTNADRDHPMLAYVHEGLVRGAWNRSKIAPRNRATAVIAGDHRWIGADAFKYSENLFRYIALTPTIASMVPLEFLTHSAPRQVLIDALKSISLDWCTTASVVSLSAESLERRTMLLLYDMSRVHPRPELEVRQRDIADLLGVARQTMQPVLKRLEKTGLITLGYSEIVVTDAPRLFRELRTPPERPPTEGQPKTR